VDVEQVREPAPNAETGNAVRGTGRNLPIAVAVGLVLGALVLLSLYTVKEIFLGLIAAFLIVAGWELIRAFEVRGFRIAPLPLLIGGLAMLVTTYVWGAGALIISFALTAMATLLWRMPEGQNGYVRDVMASLLAAVYVPFLAGFAALMLADRDGPDRVLTFIAVTVASDIGGYFAGSFFGRHKMAPAISPKKTWEGFSGSALTCMTVGALLVPWLVRGVWWQGMIIGGAAVCVATLGDLVESMIKRDLGIKDMGTLLPGHGGVLDRLDSLLFTVPVVWLMYEVFLPAS
jgi:phosphatidate cytidylyltransferase